MEAITVRQALKIAEDTVKMATDDLRRSGAAFAADALHHRMTGARVVLEDDAAEELASMLCQHADIHEMLLKMVRGLVAYCEQLKRD
jgi:hypothetical protein